MRGERSSFVRTKIEVNVLETEIQYHLVVTGKFQLWLPKRCEEREIIFGGYFLPFTDGELTESDRVLMAALKMDRAIIMLNACSGVLPQRDELRVNVMVSVNGVVSVDAHRC
jgi:hypothetical protein